ncbi:hypothetical protein ACHAW6_001389 [Cyclotella cf. meneghiniana]
MPPVLQGVSHLQEVLKKYQKQQNINQPQRPKFWNQIHGLCDLARAMRPNSKSFQSML